MLDWLQRAFLVKGDNPRRGSDKVYDIMHERLLQSVRDLMADHPDLAEFRDAAERAAQADTVSTGLTWSQCVAILRCWDRVAWDSRSAGVVLSSLIRQFSREKFERFKANRARAAGKGRTDGRQAQLIPVGQEPDVWWRDRLAQLARAATLGGDASLSPLARLQTSWWMNVDEILARIKEPPDPEADELALQSALHGPRHLMRGAILELTRRLGNER